MIRYLNERSIQRAKDKQVYDDYLRELGGTVEQKQRLSERQEALIRDRVAHLPRAERVAIYLRFWECRSFSEIANVIGVPTPVVAKLIDNALSRLQSDLQAIARGYGKAPQTESAA